MAEFDGTGFLGAIGGVLAGLATFLKGFLAITTAQILRLLQYLRDQLVELGKQMLTAVWAAGRALARALVTIGRLAFSGVKQFVLWAADRLKALQQWLKDVFGPVLRFLKQIKDHLDDIYKRFVRPIIDAIEFIRQINRVLQAFHITVLQKLDLTLQEIETRIEAPFLWARQHITELENWINRIVTLDGLFQRVTLLRSLKVHAPAWLRTAVAQRTKPLTGDQSYAIVRANEVPSIPDVANDLRAYLNDGTSNIGPVVDEAIARARAYLDLA